MAPAPLILIADDNTWMQRIVAKIVASYGWEPITAADGYEAVALALDRQPDVIILDLIMPDLTGMHVLRLLKRLPQTSAIPVLILSVATEVELLMEAMKCGAAGFIRKPFTRSTIYEKIAAILGTSTEPASPPSTYESEPTSETPSSQAEPERQPSASSAPIARYQQQSTPPLPEELRRWLDSI
ncbi:putative transcriptional regulatory protein TcrX [bacterium HR20]|jgi:DNA-binding response OmpR family regulator|nr:putative transcriptional regulatory protein TcrX [bacterium HR20]